MLTSDGKNLSEIEEWNWITPIYLNRCLNQLKSLLELSTILINAAKKM